MTQQPDDVLLAINGTPVKTTDQVREVVAKSDKSVALLIHKKVIAATLGTLMLGAAIAQEAATLRPVQRSGQVSNT